MKRFIVCIRVKNKVLDIEVPTALDAEAASRRARVAIMFSRRLDLKDIEVLGVHEERELTFDEVESFGLDPTGRDGDPRFPYKISHMNLDERMAVSGANARG